MARKTPEADVPNIEVEKNVLAHMEDLFNPKEMRTQNDLVEKRSKSSQTPDHLLKQKEEKKERYIPESQDNTLIEVEKATAEKTEAPPVEEKVEDGKMNENEENRIRVLTPNEGATRNTGIKTQSQEQTGLETAACSNQFDTQQTNPETARRNLTSEGTISVEKIDA